MALLEIRDLCTSFQTAVGCIEFAGRDLLRLSERAMRAVRGLAA